MKISIRGPIVTSNDQRYYDYYGIDAASPKSVRAALAAGNGEPAEVEINSGGGEIFAASEIYTELKNYSGGVKIKIVGLAASAASVIAMAGESEMAATGMMMIHNVQSWASGDYRDMEHTGDILRQANKAIASAYIDKTGMSESDALALMDAETWITAERAVEMGLVDKVMDTASKPMEITSDYNAGLLSEDAKQRAEAALKIQGTTPDFINHGEIQAKLNLLKLRGGI